MSTTRTGAVVETLHRATHRIPGMPEHIEHPPGHQGQTAHGRVGRHAALRHRPVHHGSWHHKVRRPRVLEGWQRRIGALFGQWLP